MRAQPKIDVAMLAQLQDLLAERFTELLETFIRDGERRMNLLRQAVPERDFVTIHAEAHGLKGSGRNIGANPLGEACSLLETIGREEQEADLDTTFAAVEQEFAAVCGVLRSYIP